MHQLSIIDTDATNMGEDPLDKREDETTREWVARVVRSKWGDGEEEFSAKDVQKVTGLPIALAAYHTLRLVDDGHTKLVRTGGNTMGSPRKYYIVVGYELAA